jgi:hypothetical protein
MGSEDTARAGPCGEVVHLGTSALTIKALVGEADLIARGGTWVAHCHAEALQGVRVSSSGALNVVGEYRRESLDWLLPDVIPGKVELGIVDGETACSALGPSKKRLDGKNRHAVVRAIGRILKVEVGSPVVREVLRHLAGGACGPRTNITLHASVKCVSANDVMNVGGWEHARLDDRIQALDGQGRAWESKASVDRRNKRECGGERLHLGDGGGLAECCKAGEAE